jgi:precorrin-3B methylase
MNPIEIVLLVMGSSGVGGLVIGLYNAWVSARKGTVEEWRGLLEEQREIIEEQNKVIAEQKTIIAEQKQEIVRRDRMIDDLKDWATRLVQQLAVHAPSVKAEEFIRRSPQP